MRETFELRWITKTCKVNRVNDVYGGGFREVTESYEVLQYRTKSPTNDPTLGITWSEWKDVPSVD